MECDVLNDAVTLVEDAQHGHALCHRGHASLAVGRGGDLPARPDGLLVAAIAADKHGREQQCHRDGAHVYSGIQGS